MTPPPPTTEREVFLTASPGTRWIRGIVRAIVVFVVLILVLSMLVPVDEVVKARGEVVPVGDVQLVQTIDGGMIQEILVEEGQAVKAGDVIARFEPTGVKADLGSAMARRAALAATAIRLEAFIEKKEPDFSVWEPDFPRIVASQREALAAARAALDRGRDILAQRVNEAREEIAGTASEIPVVERQQKTAAQAVARLKSAVEKGSISRNEYDARLQEEAGYARQLADLRGRLAVAREKLTEAEQALEEVDEKAASEARNQRIEAIAKLRETEEELANLNRRVERTTLLAPVDGFVTSLPETDFGAVIQAGGVVAQIVPATTEFLFKAKVPPKDIGFVQMDDTAVVKIDAFDYSRYGSLPGQVSAISPTTIVNREGTPFFEVRIQLGKSQFQIPGRLLSVSSGMTGEADIRTGRKTVFQYLWKPVFTTFQTAFTER